MKFDKSYIQQILDLMKNDDTCYTLFLNKVFEVFFRGRNKVIDKDDIKFIIKSSAKNPCIFIEKLLGFTRTKQDGGARTPNQLHKAISMINYVFDLRGEQIVSENNEENNTNLALILGQIKKSFKSCIKEETKKPNYQVFHHLAIGMCKFVNLHLAKNVEISENVKESIKKLLTNFQTLAEKVKELKNINAKIEELKNKISI